MRKWPGLVSSKESAKVETLTVQRILLASRPTVIMAVTSNKWLKKRNQSFIKTQSSESLKVNKSNKSFLKANNQRSTWSNMKLLQSLCCTFINEMLLMTFWLACTATMMKSTNTKTTNWSKDAFKVPEIKKILQTRLKWSKTYKK